MQDMHSLVAAAAAASTAVATSTATASAATASTTAVAATAASTTAVAATAARTATAVTATAAARAATESTATRTGRTRLHRACFVHYQTTAAELLTVHAVDGCLCLGVATHFHKTETLGTTSVTFHHDFRAGYGAVR